METNTNFRDTKPQGYEPPKEPKDLKVSGESNVEVPFLDYQSEHKRPFCADFFGLGDTGNNDIYQDDIGLVENYLKSLISKGKIPNNTNTVREKIKQMEKMVGYDKTERTVVKLAKMAAYVKFLQETDSIETQSNKYV